MKCPFRRVSVDRYGKKAEHYMECYGSECPFYEPPKTYRDGISIMESCKRTSYKENTKDNERI